MLGQPLAPCSMDPLTGFYRDGCCNTDHEDTGIHTVCVRVTAKFLAFSKAQGNDLSTPAPQFGFDGLKPGDQWCLCAGRWREALDAGMAPPVDPGRDARRNPGHRAAGGTEAARAGPGLKGSRNWWSGRGSNPRPPHCERGALPSELPPHGRGANSTAEWALRAGTCSVLRQVTTRTSRPPAALSLPPRRKERHGYHAALRLQGTGPPQPQPQGAAAEVRGASRVRQEPQRESPSATPSSRWWRASTPSSSPRARAARTSRRWPCSAWRAARTCTTPAAAGRPMSTSRPMCAASRFAWPR